MKQKFSQSYSKREEALFTKMKSRRLQRWYNSRLSKIDSQQKIWLIIFTRPHKENQEWNLKFWVWSSEDNTILGENILFTYYRPETPKDRIKTFGSLKECYIQEEFEYVVFRPIGHRCLIVYDFQGNMLIQTDNFTEFVKENSLYFSKFLTKNILFSKSGNTLSIYYLDKRIGFKPECFELLWFNNCVPKDKDIQIILKDDVCLLSAYDISNESGSDLSDTIWVYAIPQKQSSFSFVGKLVLSVSPYNIELESDGININVSFQYYVQGKLSENRILYSFPKDMV